MDSPKEFEIKQQRGLLIFYLILGPILIAAIIVTAVLVVQGKIDKDTVGAGYLALFCALLSLPVLGIYAYFHNKFIFREGFFIFKNIFCKTKRVPVDTINVAIIYSIGRANRGLAFKDKNLECVLRVPGADALINNDLFKKVLEYYEIALTDSRTFIN
ncbi:MAG: hypothetical protein K2L02_00610 [Clostridia bacterium]|nr:hypothetical protein [Clostridia bacterium]